MREGARDRHAAVAAGTGFLVSVGAIALLIWPISHWLADFAIDPASQELAVEFPIDEQISAAKRDYRWMLDDAAFRLVTLMAFYWLLAFVFGAGKVDALSAKTTERPGVWLALAILIGVGGAFLGAARRLVIAPLVDACVRREIALDARAVFTSGTIHGCESQVGLVFGVTGLLLMFILMGVSLRLRVRYSIPGRRRKKPKSSRSSF